jgi:hypothetical protein
LGEVKFARDILFLGAKQTQQVPVDCLFGLLKVKCKASKQTNKVVEATDIHFKCKYVNM